MADFTELKQSARLTQDTEGNPVVQLSPQNWESLISRIENENKHQNLLRTLLQEWAEELETAPIPHVPLNSASVVNVPVPFPKETQLPKRTVPTRYKPRQSRLQSGIQSLLRSYKWSILPLFIISVLLVNNRMYYDTFNGYDMPQHFNNTLSIMSTGMMPPSAEGWTYEAAQPPLFYVLAAWLTQIGAAFFDDPFQKFATVMLFPATMLWALLLTLIIQKTMRRVHSLLKALTLCVVALFPLSVQTMTMFSNDMPVTILCLVGAFLLWLMIRSGRQLDFRMWLRAAVVIALAIAFKNTAVVLAGTYAGLALYIVGGYIIRRRFAQASRVFIYAAIGVPMMLIPYALNTWHASSYDTNPFGGTFGGDSGVGQFNNWGFFFRFDDTLFQSPFAFGPGEGSFWSLQYVTLHNDYYNHWNSVSYWAWPPETMKFGVYRDIIPIERFNTAIFLQYVAIPVTLLMVFAFVVSLVRMILWPRKALREGSTLVVILTVVTQGALVILYLHYSYLAPPIIHARYLVFLYPFLLIIGVMWLWKILSGYLQWQRIVRPAVTYIYAAVFVVYTFAAFKLMWLPTHWK